MSSRIGGRERRRRTEENKTIEDEAAGVAGEQDADCPVEHGELWGVDRVRWDLRRHG